MAIPPEDARAASRRRARVPRNFAAIIGTSGQDQTAATGAAACNSGITSCANSVNRPLRFRKRQIAERELPDAVVAAGRGELLAQERRHGARRARDTLSHLGEAVEIRRARMRGREIVPPVQAGEALMPARIGAARQRERLGVGVGHDDETAEPHQRQRRVVPGVAPGRAEGVERGARRRHGVEADHAQAACCAARLALSGACRPYHTGG